MPLNVTRAAVLAMPAVDATPTLIVQVCPCGSMLSLQTTRVVFPNEGDCVQEPPEAATTDWIVTPLGKCPIKTTPFASIVPRFATCHVSVPLPVPVTYVPLSARSVTTAGVGVGVGVGIGVGVGVGVGGGGAETVVVTLAVPLAGFASAIACPFPSRAWTLAVFTTVAVRFCVIPIAAVLPDARLPRLQVTAVAVAQLPWLGIAEITDALFNVNASVMIT